MPNLQSVATCTSPRPTIAIVFCIASFFFSSQSHAQNIKLDGSLGARTTLTGPAYTIPHDLGQTRGANLFHSFEQFNILTGESATFTGPNTISRVISRVTGGVQSFIDGLLGTDFAAAKPEFYLINPSGILFGPNASLNVSGSAHLSTADYLRFADQTGQTGLFAKLSETTTLSIEPVSAFGFLGPTVAPITVQRSVDGFLSGADFSVPTGNTLSLVGGDLTVTADPLLGEFSIHSISAPSGLIQLASSRTAGEFPINLHSFNTSHIGSAASGQILVSQGALITAASDVSDLGGGTVVIRSGKLVLDNAFIFADTLGDGNGATTAVDAAINGELALRNGAAITADVLAAGKGGDILIRTGSAEVGTDSFFAARSFGDGRAGNISITAEAVNLAGGRVTTLTGGTGDAGGITLDLTRLTLTEGAQISVTTLSGSTGQGGRLTISAGESVAISGQDLSGNASGLFANAQGLGNGGVMTITTPELSMSGGRLQAIATSSGGGGDIILNVGSAAFVGSTIQAEARSTGRAGNIAITGRTVSMTSGALISIDSTLGSTGRAGSLAITADDVLFIGGRDSTGFISGISANTRGTGAGGTIYATAPNIVFQDARVQAGTFGPGDGGAIQLNADRISLLDGGQVSTTARATSSGNAGSITAIATEAIMIEGRGPDLFPSGFFAIAQGTGLGGSITLSSASLTVSNARISTSTFGPNAGGPVEIDVRQLTLRNDGEIISQSQSTGSGPGGTITIMAAEGVHIVGNDAPVRSGIFISSLGGGPAGTLVLQSPTVLLEGGDIIAAAFGQGDGGHVRLDVGDLRIVAAGQINTATVATGKAGDVHIVASGNVTIQETVRFSPNEIAASAIQSQSLSRGSAGNVFLAAQDVTLLDGGRIDASTTGAGAGGTITVQARETISLSGESNGILTSIASTSADSGAGGNINLTAGKTITVSDQAQVTATSSATGNAGNIVLETETLTVQGEAQITSSTFGSGSGGTIRLTVADRFSMAERALVTANTDGMGMAGNIILDVGELAMLSGAGVTSLTSGTGHAGFIDISARTFILVSGSRPSAVPSTPSVSTIASSTLLTPLFEEVFGIAGGDAGRVTIQTPHLTVEDQGTITTSSFNAGQGGNIDVTVGTASLLSGGRIESNANGRGHAGTIAITAQEELQIMGRDPEGNSSHVASVAFPGAMGNAGTITIDAPRVTLDQGQIAAFTGGAGNGGTLTLTVGNLSADHDSQISSATQGAGKGGNIFIAAQETVSVVGHSLIDSSTLGTTGADAGSIHVSAKRLVVGSEGSISAATGDPTNVGSPGTGRGGNIELTVGRLDLLTGADLDTSTFGSGHGGTVQVTATDGVLLSGRDAQGNSSVMTSIAVGSGAAGGLVLQAPAITFEDGALLSANTAGAGAAGNITLAAGQLSMAPGTRVTSRTLDSSSGPGGNVTINGLNSQSSVTLDGAVITTSTASTGSGGNVVINTGQVTLSHNARITSDSTSALSGAGNAGTVSITSAGGLAVTAGQVTTETAEGAGGDIALRAQSLLLNEVAVISTRSTGSGNSGNIAIVATDLFQSQNSQVTTEATQAFGGNIDIQTQRMIQLTDSQIVTSVQSGIGNGGNISIDPQFLILDNTQILAQAIAGNGGNISIVAGTMLVSPDSVINASSQTGISGQVAIQAPVNNIATALSRLSQSTLNATELLTARCSARLREGRTSSLTLAGRDGVPAEPGGYRPTAFVASASRPTSRPARAARSEIATQPPLVLQSPSPEFYALRDASPLPLGCGS